MTATATETNETKKAKPTLKIEFIDGRQVCIVPERMKEKMRDVHDYCLAVDEVPQIQNEVRGVCDAIDALFAKIK